MPDTASFWNERGAWLRKEATALRNRQEFQRSQLTELANNDFESWAKESFEIATKIDYRNGGRIGIPKGGNMDCTMIATAPVLPVGYVVSASRIADSRMILAAYRLADRPTRVTRNFDCRRSIQFNYTVTFDMSDRHRLPVLLVHPFSPDWYVGGSVLVPGRSSSIVEIGRFRFQRFTVSMKELAEWFGLEVARIVVDECLAPRGN